jgi:hypothetical protein
MLPPGHIAAGYLTALAAIKIFKPDFDQQQINQLLVLGMFWGFAPDLDVFYSFYKLKSFTSDINKADHRKFVSHSPLLWLAVGIIFYFFVSSPFLKFNALVFVAGSFSHFILDSIEYGIPWLWPFKSRLFAIINPGKKIFEVKEKSFFKHWTAFVKFYITRPTFYFELLIISLFVIISI